MTKYSGAKDLYENGNVEDFLLLFSVNEQTLSPENTKKTERKIPLCFFVSYKSVLAIVFAAKGIMYVDIFSLPVIS